MKKTEYARYLQSPEWQERRQQKIEEVGNRCERCDLPRWLAEIAYDQDLNVHHRTYARRGSENLDDLEVLCRRCHEIVTFRRSELRAPKKATCERCESAHWDYRSSACSMCSSALKPGDDFEFWVAVNFGEILNSLAELAVRNKATDVASETHKALNRVISRKRSQIEKGGAR